MSDLSVLLHKRTMLTLEMSKKRRDKFAQRQLLKKVNEVNQEIKEAESNAANLAVAEKLWPKETKDIAVADILTRRPDVIAVKEDPWLTGDPWGGCHSVRPEPVPVPNLAAVTIERKAPQASKKSQ